MKEQVPEKKSRSGRSITSSVRDSSGCTVRDCKQDAADDKRAKCVVNACRRLQFLNVLIIVFICHCLHFIESSFYRLFLFLKFL